MMANAGLVATKKKMDVVPLAPRALSCPHPYDPTNEVFVRLDEPLWLSRPREREVAVEILSLCVQMDCVLLSSSKAQERRLQEEAAANTSPRRSEHKSSSGHSTESVESHQKRVTFEKVLASKVTSIWYQMQEQLSRAAITCDLQSYLQERGFLRLFPRLEQYLHQPDTAMEATPTAITSVMDAYLSHLTQLHGIKALAHQLLSSSLSVQHHKYIAHVVAVLYQCLSRHPQLMSFKKEIEANFNALKTCCMTSPAGHPPKLHPHLKTWLQEFCSALVDRTLSLSSDLFTSHSSTQEVLHTISCVHVTE